MNALCNTAISFHKKWKTIILINIAVIIAISIIFYLYFYSLWLQTRPVVFVDTGEAFTTQISTQRVLSAAYAAIADTSFGSNSMALEPFMFNQPIFKVPIVGNDDAAELKATVYVSAVTGEVLSITFHVSTFYYDEFVVKSREYGVDGYLLKGGGL